MSSAVKNEVRLSLIDVWIKDSTNYLHEPNDANLITLLRQFKILRHSNLEEVIAKDPFTSVTFMNNLRELLSLPPNQASVMVGSLELLRLLFVQSTEVASYCSMFFPPLLELLKSKKLNNKEHTKLVLEVIVNVSAVLSITGIFEPWMPKLINFLLSELVTAENHSEENPFLDPVFQHLALNILANLSLEKSKQALELISCSPSFKAFTKFCYISEVGQASGMFVVEILGHSMFSEFFSPDSLLPFLVNDLKTSLKKQNSAHLRRFLVLFEDLLRLGSWKLVFLQNTEFKTFMDDLLSNLLTCPPELMEAGSDIVCLAAETELLDQVTISKVLSELWEHLGNTWALKLLEAFFRNGQTTLEGFTQTQNRLLSQLTILTKNCTAISFEDCVLSKLMLILRILRVLSEKDPASALGVDPELWHNWCLQILLVSDKPFPASSKAIPDFTLMTIDLLLLYATLSTLNVEYTPGYTEIIGKDQVNQALASVLMTGEAQWKKKALQLIRLTGFGDANLDAISKMLGSKTAKDQIKSPSCVWPTDFYARTFCDAEKLGTTESKNASAASLARLAKNVWSVSQVYMETQRRELEHQLAMTSIQTVEALSSLMTYTEKCEKLETKLQEYKTKLKDNVQVAQQAVLEHRQIIKGLQGQLANGDKMNAEFRAREEVMLQRYEKMKLSQEKLKSEMSELQENLLISENHGVDLEAEVAQLKEELSNEETAKLEQVALYKNLAKEMEKKEETIEKLKLSVELQDQKLKDAEQERQRLQKLCDFIKDLTSKK